MSGTAQQAEADWPRKMYAVDLDALRTLADAVCELDALKGYMITTEQARIEALISNSFQAIRAAAGLDAGEIFEMSEDGPDPSAPKPLKPAVRDLISRLAAAQCEVGWPDRRDCYCNSDQPGGWCWPCAIRSALL